MNIQISKPSSFLSQYIKQYWAIDNCLPTGSEHIQRIVPNGMMELMFYLCKKPQSLDNNKNINDNTILCGQQKGFYDIKITQNLSIFSISFLPHGAAMFFDIPLNEFYNQNVSLQDFLKDKAEKLEMELFNSDSFASKINIVENFLMQLFIKKKKLYEMNRITNSIALINQSKGVLSIESLSSNACLSLKQFERTFSEYVGISPKQFLKIVRFQNTLLQKHLSKNKILTELAYECGYYDQSHMTNEYKSLSGKTPTQYFSDCEPFSDYF